MGVVQGIQKYDQISVNYQINYLDQWYSDYLIKYSVHMFAQLYVLTSEIELLRHEPRLLLK